jgi:para-nitrobenzyl esterase
MKLRPMRISTQVHSRRRRSALAFVLSSVFAVLACWSRAAFAAPVIITDQGPLSGLSVPGENEYLGIPYAAQPDGRLRWRPPDPPAHFNGVFKATEFGSRCPQLQNGIVTGSEHCLHLNVYVPDTDPPAQGFPVMVWIHGGGLVDGAGSDYDPTPLVKKGHVIVVTINYRLGLLGFFAHPAIDSEGHLNANYGLMDQQFALEWVRRNIGAFGGDSERVTIFGESAGGFSVLSDLASPTAAGLFEGGIVESGAYAEFQDYFDSVSVVPLVTAETIGTSRVPAGTALASAVGCSSQTAQCLRATSASALVKIEPGTVFPIIDGTVLTQTLDSAFASGEFNRVPIINGTNHDEWRYFVAEEYDLSGHPLTNAKYPAAVAALFGLPVTNSFVQLVLSEYPLSNYPPPQGYFVSAPLALGAVGTDWDFACTARNADLSLSKYVPTYTYEFNDETAPPFLSGLSFPQGDSHEIELEYLFNMGVRFTTDQQRLSDTMIDYWTQFARTGNPNGREHNRGSEENGDSGGSPNWPLYRGVRGRFESLVAPTPKTESDSSFDNFHKCSSFWNTF